MSRRSVGFTMNGKGEVEQKIPQFGGVKGEHNATELSVTVTATSFYQKGDVARLEFCAGDGTVLSSDMIDNINVEGDRMSVFYRIPKMLTMLGGQLCVRLVVSRMDENDNETQTFRSGEMVLWFEDAHVENGTPFWTGVSQMLVRTASAKETAVAAQEIAVDSASKATQMKASAQDSADRSAAAALESIAAKNTAVSAAGSATTAVVRAIDSEQEAKKAAADAKATAQRIDADYNADNVKTAAREAVADYFEKHPEQGGMTPEQSQKLDDTASLLASHILSSTKAVNEKFDKSGHAANKFLGTDESGNVVAKEAPIGGNVTAEQVAAAVEVYLDEHPVDCNISPISKTDEMTQPVGVDANGQLWVAPIGGGTGGGNTGGGDSGDTGSGDDSGNGETTESIKQDLTFATGSLSWSDGTFTINPSVLANISTEALIDASNGDMQVVFPYSADYCSAETGDFACGIWKYDTGGNFISTVDLEGNAADNNWKTVAIGSTITWQGGFKYRLVFKRGIVSSNANLLKWANECLEVYVLSAISTDNGETVSVAQMVDNDYLQDYGVSTLSLITETATDSTSFEWALETAKNEWMREYGGDINKIPLIIHTDQHGYLERGKECGEVFDTISSRVNWYDISKVINLGDTINSYPNHDDLTAACQGLENYLDAMKEVPYSKRIEVFGNHDCMYMDGAVLTAIYHDQSYLQPYFRNILARKTSNNGYFVVKDDNFNVKYVVVSSFEFDEAWANKQVMSSKQIDWLIDELSKEDGYDVVLLSHVKIDADWGKTNIGAVVAARKAKTAGSITDAYGVEHIFDFSGCDGELLCSLHGHSHEDAHDYSGDALWCTFSHFYASPRCLHFALIDRANRQLNVWKVDSTPTYQNYQIPLDQTIE